MPNGVDLHVNGKVAHVVLARPDRRNAFDTDMLAAFEDAQLHIARSKDIEVAVLRGEGPSFCAGTDLKQLQNLNAEETLRWQRVTGELVERWTRLEATTITAFNGPAIGSGAVVGLASDLRLAAAGTWFSFPEVTFGLPLTWSGIPILTALLGPDRTKRALLLRERIEEKELVSLGLVLEVVAVDALAVATDRLVANLLETPLIGRLMTKRAVAAATAAPGLMTASYEPFLASLSIAARGPQAFAYKDKASS